MNVFVWLRNLINSPEPQEEDISWYSPHAQQVLDQKKQELKK